MTLREANDMVRRLHRHSVPVVGCRFAVGARLGGQLVGVAIVGRPVARALDDGCTDGTRNACSLLYGACRRICRAMGYRAVVTYTLASESGASLRAAGARPVAEVEGREWDTPSRPRLPMPIVADRIRWEL